MLMLIYILLFCSGFLVTSLSPYEESNVEEKNHAIRRGEPLKYDFLDDYHFPMVADEVRNGLFYSALQKAIVPNMSKLLDVRRTLILCVCVYVLIFPLFPPHTGRGRHHVAIHDGH
jgi:hypothetical protein